MTKGGSNDRWVAAGKDAGVDAGGRVQSAAGTGSVLGGSGEANVVLTGSMRIARGDAAADEAAGWVVPVWAATKLVVPGT